MSATDVSIQMRQKLNELVTFGVLQPNSYNVNIPLRSRQDGQHSNVCFVKFNSDVPMAHRLVAKTIMFDSPWFSQDDRRLYVKCFWMKKQENRPRQGNYRSRNNEAMSPSIKSGHQPARRTSLTSTDTPTNTPVGTPNGTTRTMKSAE